MVFACSLPEKAFRKLLKPRRNSPLDWSSINQSTNRSKNWSINQSINQSIEELINQSTNQRIDQSINQTKNWSINSWEKLKKNGEFLSAYPASKAGPRTSTLCTTWCSTKTLESPMYTGSAARVKPKPLGPLHKMMGGFKVVNSGDVSRDGEGSRELLQDTMDGGTAGERGESWWVEKTNALAEDDFPTGLVTVGGGEDGECWPEVEGVEVASGNAWCVRSSSGSNLASLMPKNAQKNHKNKLRPPILGRQLFPTPPP